ncbi:MAG: hypothetical protein ACLT33_07955 [Lachnospira pectinoschiza]
MKDVAGNLDDNREQNIEWFVRENDLPVKQGEDTFEWKHNGRIYDCRLRDFQMKKPTAGYYYCYAGCVGVKEGLC